VLTEVEKKVIGLLQGDIPLDSRPFSVMAGKIGITEDQFLDRVKKLSQRGIIRRFGATLRHQEAGFSSNAMVAWAVPQDKIEKAGNRLAQFQEVTHCYLRMPKRDWPYNLYTMVHGADHAQCNRLVERMSRSTGISDFVVLFSEKEFKKTSMVYF
jgi:DNA-binding Lrp family transcriptional regulator